MVMQGLVLYTEQKNTHTQENRFIYLLEIVFLIQARNDVHDVAFMVHISRLSYEDLECGLKLVNKFTSDHINLTSYSVMRVNLAAQVLSGTVGNVLNSFGPEETAGTILYYGRKIFLTV